MAKEPKKFVIQEENTSITVDVPNFTKSAFSIVKLDGQWYTAEIPIDPITRQTGEWKLTHQDNKPTANERFKIMVAHSLMVKND